MAYDKSNLRAVHAGTVNAGPRLWIHSEASLTGANFDTSGYIANGGEMGMKVGDLVFHLNVATNIWTTHVVVSVSSTKPGAVDLSDTTTLASGTAGD